MGTLYVSPLPAGDLDDWPLRARRLLSEVSLVTAQDLRAARLALRDVPLAAPLVDATEADSLLSVLGVGDAMLLLEGELAGPPGPALALVRSAVERGFPVVALPGPVLPVTALVASGLPAASFVWLGVLPEEPAAQRALLACTARERRTLVLVTSRFSQELWDSMCGELGVRPICLCAEGGPGSITWRGRLDPQAELPALPDGPLALVIGGSCAEVARWPEERVRSEVQACLGAGTSARQAAKQLAAPSGWPRREVYRLATRAAEPVPPGTGMGAGAGSRGHEEIEHDRSG